MKGDRVLVSLAIVAFIVAIIAAFITYSSISNVFDSITGRQVGEANLTVETNAEVNFTTRAISWGSGKVNPSSESASLTTHLGSNNVTGGNWSLQTAGGLRIENIGNVNVTLNLSVGKTPDTFIGGTNPVYQWNLTDVEANSCLNITGGSPSPRMNEFFNASPANVDTLFCDVFRFESGNDLVRLDFNLTVPEDSLTGDLGDVITATVTAV